VEDKPAPEEKPAPVPQLPPPAELPTAEADEQIKPDVQGAALLGAARNAVRRGDLDEAITRFEDYLSRYPDDRAVRQEYAGVLVQASRLKKAVEQYRQLIAAQPRRVELRLALGDVYLLSRDYRQAVAQFRQALDIAPDNLEAAIKLARAYAIDNDFTGALNVFDRYLGKVRPGDENVPRSYAALLLDLERPRDALAFLQPLREKEPKDLEVLGYVVRAHARLGERDKALAAVAEMGKLPGGIPLRLQLGETLYQSGELELATLVFGQVLQIDPTNATAVVGIARVQIEQYHPHQARHLLESVTPTGTARRLYQFAWAEYHQVVGEYTQAKAIFWDFLRRDRSDVEARLALARLYETIREDERAKTEYCAVPPEGGYGRRARLGFATVLYNQRHFTEAAALAQQLLGEEPNDSGARALLSRIFTKTGQCGKAEALGRSFLQSNPRSESAILGARIALARALFDCGKFLEAGHEYELALASPAGRTPPVFYGLMQVHEKLHQPEKAAQTLAHALALPGAETRMALLIADEYTADFDDYHAMDLIHGVLKNDPQNLAALIRLADAQARAARQTGDISEATATAETILHLSPTNYRGYLALARALATGKKYDASVATYDKLIALDPDTANPRRERARVLYSHNGFAAAQAAYHDLPPPPDPSLAPDLGPAANEPPNLPVLNPAATPPGGGNPAALPAAEDPWGGMQTGPGHYDGQQAIATGSALEARAKDDKGIRNWAAIHDYQNLLAFEPDNTEGLFDLGQVYAAALQQTHKEIDTYGALLQVDPLHHDGAEALERASAELQPQVNPFFRDFIQRGRDGLASIDRYYFGVLARVPTGDENEYFAFGYQRAFYRPTNGDPSLSGNIFTLRAQEKYPETVLWYGQLNYEQYADRIANRPTFDAGTRWDVCDTLHLRSSIFLENVVENGGTLQQDIYRTGFHLAADWNPLRRLTFDADYSFSWYSDVNYRNELYATNGILLTYLPAQLKLVQVLDVLSFANQTEPRNFIPNSPEVNFLVHPYFSPRAFAYYECRLEWLHYLSRDYFTHADVCYYGLQAGLAVDSKSAVYETVRALVNWDVTPYLTVGADVQAMLSDVYRETSAWVYLVARLPCFYK
jgi:tetratricopeptide (TPR) repeat protein